MDLQELFNVAIGLLLTVGGWLFKSVWDAQARMRRDFSELEKNLPLAYVRKDDFIAHAERVEGALLRIEDKLDKKVDKA